MAMMMAACSKDLIKVPIEIVLFENVKSPDNQYPIYFKEILEPSQDVCDKKITFGYYPINFKRKDYNAEFILDYLNNKQGNDKKIKFVSRQLKTYFEMNKLDSILTHRAAIVNGNFDEYVKAHKESNDVFYYSLNDEIKMNGVKVYYSNADLRKSISESVCKDSSQKIVVVIIPSGFLPEPDLPTHIDSNMTSSTSSDNVNKIFKSLTNKTVSKEERLKLVPQILNTYFTDKATVEPFEVNGTPMQQKYMKEYLEEIVFYLSLDSIQVLKSFSDANGKYDNVQIVEHHNN
jgi:hypothetical protein